MKTFNFLMRVLTACEKYICIASIGIMFLIGALEVICRNIFNLSFYWVQELIIVFLVWEVYMGAAYIFNTGELISVDLLYGLFGEKGQRIFEILIDLLSLAVLFVVIRFGILYQSTQIKFHTAALRIPESIHSIPLVICALSMALQIVRKWLLYILKSKGGRDENGVRT